MIPTTFVDPPSPIGWPWPLDAVQGWFEDLWDQIVGTAEAAAKWVWDILPDWLKDPILALKGWIDGIITWVRDHIGWWDPVQRRFVGGFLGWLWDTLGLIGKMISNAAGWVWEQVEPVVAPIAEGIKGFFDWLWTQIQVGIDWLKSTIWSWVDGSLRWLTDTFKWLQGEIGAIVGDAQTAIITAFDGAFAGITDVFKGWPALLTEAISAIFEPLFISLGAVASTSSPTIYYGVIAPAGWYQPQIGWLEGVIGKGLEAGFRWLSEALAWFAETAWKWLSEKVLTPLWEGLRWLWNWITLQAQEAFDIVADLFKGFSSITPEDAYALSPKVLLAAAGLGLAATGITSIAGIKVMGTGLEVGEIGSYIKDLLSPGMFVGATLGTLIGVGLTTPLRYYYQKAFTPLIPPIPDLIRFVVREVILPETFVDLAAYHGYSKERAQWYWDAHWILPSPRDLYDAFHRGEISGPELDKFLEWHDYSPKPRPGIEKTDIEIMRSVLKTLIPRVDLRYAWELGRLTDEELVAWYERLGYEEDAPLMAEIQMARSLVEEMHKVRDEWIRDYVDGFIDEDVLRANLAEIGIGPRRIDYYVIYAMKRRDRERLRDLLDLYRDGFMKDLITEEELRDRVLEIIIIPEVADLFVEKAYVDKYKKPKPPTETTEEKALKELQKYQVTYAIQAYRRYAIEKDELVDMLIEAGVDPAVARTRADYEELKRPIPKPPPDIIAADKEKARIQKLEEAKAIAEYRADLIDSNTLLKRLIEIDYSEALATAITQLEIIRKM